VTAAARKSIHMAVTSRKGKVTMTNERNRSGKTYSDPKNLGTMKRLLHDHLKRREEVVSETSMNKSSVIRSKKQWDYRHEVFPGICEEPERFPCIHIAHVEIFQDREIVYSYFVYLEDFNEGSK